MRHISSHALDISASRTYRYRQTGTDKLLFSLLRVDGQQVVERAPDHCYYSNSYCQLLIVYY